MARLLSSFAVRLVSDPAALRRSLTAPVLVWEAAPDAPAPPTGGEPGTMTAGMGKEALRPRVGEPMVFEVQKNPQAQASFGPGVTVGRTENNDICLADPTVSRFHAYFQQDPKTQGWRLVDANSSNGTWLGSREIPANQPKDLKDGVTVKFGSVEVRFLEPDSFLRYLEEMAKD